MDRRRRPHQSVGHGDRPQWDPAIGMLHQAFAAMVTGRPYGIGAYFVIDTAVGVTARGSDLTVGTDDDM